MATDYDIVQFYRQTSTGTKTYIVRKRQLAELAIDKSSSVECNGHAVQGGEDEKVYLMEVVQTSAEVSPSSSMDALQSHQQQNHSQATLVQYAPCPFAANLISILSSSTRTRYILEHASGGNLRSIIRRCRSARKEKGLPVETIQLYAMEIAIALHSLHESGAVYGCTLSTDTVLVDAEGHVMLSRTVHRQAYWRPSGLVSAASSCRGDDRHGNGDSGPAMNGTLSSADATAVREDWLLFARVVGEMANSRMEKSGRCAVTSTPSQTVACFIRDLYHELDGDNAANVNLEWMKRQPLFQDMDFDKVLKREVLPPPLPCEDLSKKAASQTQPSTNSPLLIRPRAQTASGRISYASPHSSPSVLSRSPITPSLTTWSRSSSLRSSPEKGHVADALKSLPISDGKVTPIATTTTSSSRHSRSQTSPDSYSPLSSRVPIRPSQIRTKAGVRSSMSPLRRSLISPTSPTEDKKPGSSSNKRDAAGSLLKQSPAINGFHPPSHQSLDSLEGNCSSPDVSVTSPESAGSSADTSDEDKGNSLGESFSSSLLRPLLHSEDCESIGILDAVMLPMSKDRHESSLTSPPPGSTMTGDATASKDDTSHRGVQPSPALNSRLSADPESLALPRQRPRSMSLIPQTSVIRRQAHSETSLPSFTGVCQAATDTVSTSTTTDQNRTALTLQNTSRPSASSTIIQSHMDAVAMFMSKSPVVQRRTVGASDSPHALRTPLTTTRLQGFTVPLSPSITHHKSPEVTSIPSPSIRVTDHSGDGVKTGAMFDFQLPDPVVLPSPDDDPHALSPSPPPQFSTPPVSRGITPPPLFMDSDGGDACDGGGGGDGDDACDGGGGDDGTEDSAIYSSRSSMAIASPISSTSTLVSPNSSLDMFATTSLLSPGEENRRRSASFSIGYGDFAGTVSARPSSIPASNRHSYSSEESVELNTQWQERMLALVRRLDCMPESTETHDLDEGNSTERLDRTSDAESSSADSPTLVKKRLNRLRQVTLNHSIHGNSSAIATSTDDDLDRSVGSHDYDERGSDNAAFSPDHDSEGGSSAGDGRRGSRGDWRFVRRRAVKRNPSNPQRSNFTRRSPGTRKKLSVIRSVGSADMSNVHLSPLPNSMPVSGQTCLSDNEGEAGGGGGSVRRSISRSPRTAHRQTSSTAVSPRTSATEVSAEVTMTERLCQDCRQWKQMEFRRLDLETALCDQCTVHRHKRCQAMKELITTEETYGQSLQVLQEVFMVPMQKGLVSSSDHSKIFLNIQELLEVHRKLLNDIKSALGDWTLVDDQQELFKVQIGSVMLNHIENFKAFLYYCVGSSQSVRLLTGLAKKSDLLRVFLRVCQMEDERCSKMGLQAFLLLPMQRITRYPLLLSKLLSHTSERHADRKLLRECMDKLGSLLDEINASTQAASVPERVRRSSSMNQPDSKPSIDISKLTAFAHQSLGWDETSTVLRYHSEVEIILKKNDSTLRPHRTGKRLLKKPPQLMYALLLHDRVIADDTISSASEDKSTADGGPSSPVDVDGCHANRNYHHYMLPRTYIARRPHLVVLTVSKENRLKCYKEPISMADCVVTDVIEDDITGVQFMLSYPANSAMQIFSVTSREMREAWMAAFRSVTQYASPWKQRRRGLANVMISTETSN